MKVPDWIHHHFPKPETLVEMKSILRDLSIHTVCEEAKCPNISECFGAKTATFLILGDVCTRNCAFCGVKKWMGGVTPPLPDPEEPKNIAKTVAHLGLSHTVITSVTRDDLPDKGAGQFVNTVIEIRKTCRSGRSAPTIELLIPQLESQDLKEIINLNPEIINHNIETVKRLYPVVRPKYDYYKSLELLHSIKVGNRYICSLHKGRETQFGSGDPNLPGGFKSRETLPLQIITKSGFMLGLGETETEVIELMNDLRNNEVDILTMGQYFRPSGKQVPVADYISPAQFVEYEKTAYSLGFRYVASGPYVRSSYKAQEAFMRTIETQAKACGYQVR